MQGLCIYDHSDYITKGKIYEIYDICSVAYELRDDNGEQVWIEKDKFILLTVEDIKSNLLPLIKFIKLLQDDVLECDLNYINNCTDNLLSALGNLELMKHE